MRSLRATLHSSIGVRCPPGPSNGRSGTRWPGLNLQCGRPAASAATAQAGCRSAGSGCSAPFACLGRRLRTPARRLRAPSVRRPAGPAPESRPSRGPRRDASKTPATCGTGWKLGEGCAIAKRSRIALQNCQAVTPVVNGFAGVVTAVNAPVVLGNHLTFGGEDKLCRRSTSLCRMAQSGRTETLLPATASAGPIFASDTIISRLETLAQ
ncbi:MAG: hypothetical protein JWQ50_7593 [Caballeronia mineralivorans]|nr:hypothetical protein [Caballeronia mineralivorans]